MQVKFDVSTVLDDRVIPLQNLKVGIKLIGIMFLFYLQLPHMIICFNHDFIPTLV